MGVSINGITPSSLVDSFHGKSHLEMDNNWGTPIYWETSICLIAMGVSGRYLIGVHGDMSILSGNLPKRIGHFTRNIGWWAVQLTGDLTWGKFSGWLVREWGIPWNTPKLEDQPCKNHDDPVGGCQV